MPGARAHAAPPGRTRRRRPWLWLAVLVVLAVAIGGITARRLTYARLEREAGQFGPLTVSVIHARKDTPAQELILPGDMRAYADTPIYARVGGYLKKWYTDIGQHVKRGQLLAEIETPEVDEQLRQASAQEQTAAANLALARTTAERWQNMLRNHSVSQQETDEKVGDMLAKKATWDSARFNAARLRREQSFQKLYAPFDGIVTARRTDVGALINPGSNGATELFHIVQDGTLRVYVGVPEQYAQDIAAGTPADLTLTAQPDKRFHGRTARTAGAVDPVTRTMQVEVAVPNPSGELLPGQYVEVHFSLRSARPALLLPGNALLFRPDGVHVVTVDDHQRAKLVPVVLGTDYGTQVAIAGGLKGNEAIVINPPDAIVDGQQLRVAAPPADETKGKAGKGGAGEEAARATGTRA